MKSEKILNAIGQISDTLIEDAAIGVKHYSRGFRLAKWTAIAACLILFLGIGFAFLAGLYPESTHTAEAYSITVKGETYCPIAFKDRIFFGLVPEDAIGLTPENTYPITKDDIGDYIGTVEACGNARFIGAELYHFTKYPDSYDIAILKIDSEYDFYVSERVSHSSPGDYPEDIITGTSE